MYPGELRGPSASEVGLTVTVTPPAVKPLSYPEDTELSSASSSSSISLLAVVSEGGGGGGRSSEAASSTVGSCGESESLSELAWRLPGCPAVLPEEEDAAVPAPRPMRSSKPSTSPGGTSGGGASSSHRVLVRGIMWEDSDSGGGRSLVKVASCCGMSGGGGGGRSPPHNATPSVSCSVPVITRCSLTTPPFKSSRR